MPPPLCRHTRRLGSLPPALQATHTIPPSHPWAGRTLREPEQDPQAQAAPGQPGPGSARHPCPLRPHGSRCRWTPVPVLPSCGRGTCLIFWELRLFVLLPPEARPSQQEAWGGARGGGAPETRPGCHAGGARRGARHPGQRSTHTCPASRFLPGLGTALPPAAQGVGLTVRLLLSHGNTSSRDSARPSRSHCARLSEPEAPRPHPATPTSRRGRHQAAGIPRK